MVINNNLMAMNTHKSYSKSNKGLSASAEKLASGLKINRSADDAAGLAISEKMRAQIRGLNMASKNSSDGASLAQTADGALQESQNVLQRMRELAVQASSDTNHDEVDREALDMEYNQLLEELDSVAHGTVFNGRKLLDGSMDSDPSYHMTKNIVDSKAGLTMAMQPAPGTVEKFTVTITKSTATEYTYSIVGKNFDGSDSKFTPAITTPNPNPFTAAPTELLGPITESNSFSFTAEGMTNAEWDAIPVGGTVLSYEAEFNSVGGMDFTMQTGANQGDTLGMAIERLDADTLGLRYPSTGTRSNLRSQTAASEAIKLCDAAINKISSQRGKLGAVQNRLLHKISNLDTSSENLSASESRIRDIDMAKEMSNYTKENILIQAGTSMLAQANNAPQNVLKLLG